MWKKYFVVFFGNRSIIKALLVLIYNVLEKVYFIWICNEKIPKREQYYSNSEVVDNL